MEKEKEEEHVIILERLERCTEGYSQRLVVSDKLTGNVEIRECPSNATLF